MFEMSLIQVSFCHFGIFPEILTPCIEEEYLLQFVYSGPTILYYNTNLTRERLPSNITEPIILIVYSYKLSNFVTTIPEMKVSIKVCMPRKFREF